MIFFGKSAATFPDHALFILILGLVCVNQLAGRGSQAIQWHSAREAIKDTT
jgi:hypothetical protein